MSSDQLSQDVSAASEADLNRSRPDVDHDVAISARDVGKCYQIYSRPQDRLKQALLRWRGRQYFREFWAVRNVSLEVRRGEAVGIIGRNGSGKSTLLQLIAGTVAPSEGEVRVNGRVAALLELGSGFNVEFTGRENVHLNAAIIGLNHEQISKRFDEVADFADIGEFIDQPVKTYSTGMVVRLAFAVHALLSPDILIVDEALAVGDEAFQRKCFAWLERFLERGGTALFVTHSAQAVVKLCRRAILLDSGRLLAHGRSKPVVDVYQKLLYDSPEQSQYLRRLLREVGGRAESLCLSKAPEAAELIQEQEDASCYYEQNLVQPQETSYGTGEAEICDVATYGERQRLANVFPAGGLCELRYKVRFLADAEGVRLGMMIKTIEGIDLAGVSNVHLGWRIPQVQAGQTIDAVFRLTLNLAPGTYFLNSGVSALRHGEEVYLHRRVDVHAVRVVPCDEREVYGLAFTDPEISYSLIAADAESYV